MIRCAEIGQYINYLKGVFMDNCKHIKPGDLRTMVDIMDAVRRCGNDGGGSGELPEDAVLYTPQEREEFEKEIARINIGATSTSEVINIINNHVPELVELLGYESLVNKQNSLEIDGTGTKYPTVDAVNSKIQELEDQINNVEIIHHYFSNSGSETINHNLGKYVQITVLEGTEVIIPNTIEHTPDMNSVTVTFIPETTGLIIIQ